MAKCKKTSGYVALKMLKKAEIVRLNKVNQTISENRILSDIDHPFIVKNNKIKKINRQKCLDVLMTIIFCILC